MNTGTLFIVATPIGNMQDITLRALETLKQVDLILCEDTRHTGQLLSYFSIQKPLKRFDDIVENRGTTEVIELLKKGQSIALVSDAGTPLVSDPGYKLVRDTIASGIRVESLPGATAAIAALTLSGLPSDRFFFVGFLPHKPGKRQKVLQKLHHYIKPAEDSEESLRATVILYESPHHLLKTFDELQAEFGDINIVVARELTKLHEEIFRGPISQAQTHLKTPKGEFVILF